MRVQTAHGKTFDNKSKQLAGHKMDNLQIFFFTVAWSVFVSTWFMALAYIYYSNRQHCPTRHWLLVPTGGAKKPIFYLPLPGRPGLRRP